MYQLNASRILYQTSKYAPVAALQLEIAVPEDPASREQICTGLDRLGSSGFADLLSPSGESSAAGIYCDLVLGLQCSAGHSVQYYRMEETDSTDETISY